MGGMKIGECEDFRKYLKMTPVWRDRMRRVAVKLLKIYRRIPYAPSRASILPLRSIGLASHT